MLRRSHTCEKLTKKGDIRTKKSYEKLTNNVRKVRRKTFDRILSLRPFRQLPSLRYVFCAVSYVLHVPCVAHAASRPLRPIRPLRWIQGVGLASHLEQVSVEISREFHSDGRMVSCRVDGVTLVINSRWRVSTCRCQGPVVSRWRPLPNVSETNVLRVAS